MNRRSFALLAALAGSTPAGAAILRRCRDAVRAEDAQAIATDAYLYFYPLLTMDITRKQLTNMAPAAGRHWRSDEQVCQYR